MTRRRKKASKSDSPPNFQVARGIFSGNELESCLWEAAWLDWNREESLTYYHTNLPKPLGASMFSAVEKLLENLPDGDGKLYYWAERHGEGDLSKAKLPVKNGTIVMLSLGQYRGGKTTLGSFKGYINPGEVLTVSVNSKSPTYQVEKITSGERLVICVAEGKHD